MGAIAFCEDLARLLSTSTTQPEWPKSAARSLVVRKRSHERLDPAPVVAPLPHAPAASDVLFSAAPLAETLPLSRPPFASNLLLQGDTLLNERSSSNGTHGTPDGGSFFLRLPKRESANFRKVSHELSMKATKRRLMPTHCGTAMRNSIVRKGERKQFNSKRTKRTKLTDLARGSKPRSLVEKETS